MADSDEDGVKKPVAYAIGQNLEDVSVDELERLIGVLADEIKRLETEKAAKSQSLDAAAALFRS